MKKINLIKIKDRKITRNLYGTNIEFSIEGIKIGWYFLKNDGDFLHFNQFSTSVLMKEIVEKELWYGDIEILYVFFTYDVSLQQPSLYDLFTLNKLYFVFSWNENLYKFCDWKISKIWNILNYQKRKFSQKEIKLWKKEIKINFCENGVFVDKKDKEENERIKNK